MWSTDSNHLYQTERRFEIDTSILNTVVGSSDVRGTVVVGLPGSTLGDGRVVGVDGLLARLEVEALVVDLAESV